MDVDGGAAAAAAAGGGGGRQGPGATLLLLSFAMFAGAFVAGYLPLFLNAGISNARYLSCSRGFGLPLAFLAS